MILVLQKYSIKGVLLHSDSFSISREYLSNFLI